MGDFSKSSWAKEVFSSNYLEKADIFIVERWKMFGIVSSIFSYYSKNKKSIHLLDLGCGDGVLSEVLLKIDNNITASLIDASQSMLDKAGDRLKRYQNVSFNKTSFNEILNGNYKLDKYDFCVSSLAIHHLDLAEKENLFKCLYDCLNTYGHFINLDVVLPPSKELEKVYFSMWSVWMQEMMDKIGITDEYPGDVIKKYIDPSSMNKPDTLEAQIESLKKIGFIDVDCYYKNNIFTVFGGMKG